eukprot:scaffold9857_cov127-Cylindrotheca_fusiformis.AAC.19
MSTYVDIDRSAEAIQEDEELIEVVNHIVEKTAEIIYEDVKNDVSGICLQLRLTIEAMFPFLVYWKENSAYFWDDMYKLSVSGVLFVIAFFVLGPSQVWVKKSSSWLSFGGKSPKNTLSRQRPASADRLTLIRKLSPFGSYTQEEPPMEPLQRSRSFSSIDCKLTNLEPEDEEEETEEEKFARKWPSIWSEARYRFLVLPPTCKRVEKPRSKVRPTLKEDKAADDENDDDKPFDRLVAYWRQFLHFAMSMMRYDYMGAGWTLIHWLESFSRVRNTVNQPSSQDENDDDESDAGSVLEKIGSRSDRQGSDASASGPVISARGKMRSKRDSLMKWQISKKKESAANPAEDGDSNDSTEKVHSSLVVGSTMLGGGEEKKDGIDDETDASLHDENDTASLSTPLSPQSPMTPPIRKEVSTSVSTSLGQNARKDSFCSVYDSPAPGFHSSSPQEEPKDEIDSSEVLASKLALNPRFAGRSKDALQNYRQSSSARKPPTLDMRPSDGECFSLASGGFLPDSGPVMQRRESADNTFYFEAASTDESLRKMAVDVPYPDQNGYIVGDEFLLDNDCIPLLVFVNSRSGPQQGNLLITQLRDLLNPIQVCDLAEGGPEEILKSFSVFTKLRILVCGGDGTVSWIVSTIEKLNLQRWPPIAILPLGTGNDLARVHGWGGGYSNESLVDILQQVAESYVSWLDRWEMTVESKKGKVKEAKSFFNYFGVGADAQMALQVHKLREHKPNLFFSRVINKAWYGIFGAEDAIKATSINLANDITLIADGVEVPLPPDSQGIILLNIDSYGGGVPLWARGSKASSRESRSLQRPYSMKRSKSLDANWMRKKQFAQNEKDPKPPTFDRVDSAEDFASLALTEEEKFRRVTSCDRPSSCQDGYLDVVSVRGSFHLGQIRVGLSTCQQLCQCQELSIVLKRKVSVQLDGEPWRQNACTLRVRRKKEAAIMLHCPSDDSNGVETEVSRLLEWAEERNYIDDKTHALLMKEFSRRIENKTRERRERSSDTLMFSLKRAMESSGNMGKGGHHGSAMF